MVKSKNLRRGFTILELLVVIAIVSLISSVVFTNARNAREKSRDARRVANIGQIRSALELFYNTNQNYPTGIYGTGATDGLTNGAYMPSVPKDPGGTEYRYAYCATAPGVRLYYHLGASVQRQDTYGLLVDRDCNSNTAGSCIASANCGGLAYSGGFTGADGAKCNAADTGTYCYDVHP